MPFEFMLHLHNYKANYGLLDCKPEAINALHAAPVRIGIRNEYCYAARSTFAKLKVIVTCTYSNFFTQGMQTRSSNVLWKTADHHGTIECMIEFA